MDARRPWPVTVVVAIVHGVGLCKTSSYQVDVDSVSLALSLSLSLAPCLFLLGTPRVETAGFTYPSNKEKIVGGGVHGIEFSLEMVLPVAQTECRGRVAV